jgi:hypothetical protein
MMVGLVVIEDSKCEDVNGYMANLWHFIQGCPNHQTWKCCIIRLTEN